MSLTLKLQRAKAIRRLAERAQDRSPHKDSAGRKADAAAELDESLGEGWREDAQPEGLPVVEIEIVRAPRVEPKGAPRAATAATMEARVRKALMADGESAEDYPEHSDAETAGAEPGGDDLGEYVCRVQDALAALVEAMKRR